MVMCCSVPQCKSNAFTKDIRFHRFPLKEKQLLELWIIRLKITKAVTKSMKVCSVHFCESDYRAFPEGFPYKRRPLRPNAMPSLNLPVSSVKGRKKKEKQAKVRSCSDSSMLISADQELPEDGTKTVLCKICNQEFESELIKTHMLDHEHTYTLKEKVFSGNRKDHRCDVCGNSFLQEWELKLHERHHKEKKFKCGVCNKSFLQVRELKSHLRIHTGMKPFTCNICKSSLSSQQSLDGHLQRCHPPSKPSKFEISPLTCTICHRVLYSERLLDRHLRCHVETFKCEICNGRLSSRQALDRHLPSCKSPSELFIKDDGRHKALPVTEKHELAPIEDISFIQSLLELFFHES